MQDSQQTMHVTFTIYQQQQLQLSSYQHVHRLNSQHAECAQ